MRFLFKMVLASAAFCVPYFGALNMKNPYPLMALSWICLGLVIWIWGYRNRKRQERRRRRMRRF